MDIQEINFLKVKKRRGQQLKEARIHTREKGKRSRHRALPFFMQFVHCIKMPGRVTEWGDPSPLTMEGIQEHGCVHLEEVSFSITRRLLNRHLEEGRQVPVLIPGARAEDFSLGVLTLSKGIVQSYSKGSASKSANHCWAQSLSDEIRGKRENGAW